jgi:hypothetical protein
MRILLAFLLGAAIATGVVWFVVKRENPPAQRAPVVSATLPATPAPVTPEPKPAAVAEVVAPAKPKPAPARVTRSSSRELVARQETPQVEPLPSPTPEPAQPATPAPAPEPAQPATSVAQLEPPPAPPPPPPPPEPKQVILTRGTLLTVRLAESLSSERVQAGDAFSATLDQPLVVEGFVIAERGARVQGTVISAEQAGRTKGLAQLSLQLTQLNTADGQKIPIRTEALVREGPKSVGNDAAKVGVAAGLGAAIGAIFGGGRGAAIGAGAGGAAGAGTVMTTRGKPAVLPVETRLSFRIKDAVTVTEKLR